MTSQTPFVLSGVSGDVSLPALVRLQHRQQEVTPVQIQQQKLAKRCLSRDAMSPSESSSSTSLSLSSSSDVDPLADDPLAQDPDEDEDP
jgi:hypothetical protein